MSFKYSAAILASLAAFPAYAADLGAPPKAPAPPAVVSPWDFAISLRAMSDYNFRGISQSDRKPSFTAMAEIKYNINENFQLYAGVQPWLVRLPAEPTAEVDLYAGIRPTFGNLSFDFGAMYYWYPGEKAFFDNFGILNPIGTQLVKNQNDFPEFYGKVAYNFSDVVSVGANVFYAANWLNTGATGTYASLTAKWTTPIEGVALSGELGRYWLGTTDAFYLNTKLPDYTYWNAGLSYTYKAATLDLRYHDTTLSKGQCFLLTTDPSGVRNGTAQSKWCSPAFIATLSFDFTSKDF